MDTVSTVKIAYFYIKQRKDASFFKRVIAKMGMIVNMNMILLNNKSMSLQ